MLFQCWLNVFDVGATLKQHWANASRLLEYNNLPLISKGAPCKHDIWTHCWLNAGSPSKTLAQHCFHVVQTTLVQGRSVSNPLE